MKNQRIILIDITLCSFIIDNSYIIFIQKKIYFPYRDKISFSVVKGGLKNFGYRGDLKHEYLQTIGGLKIQLITAVSILTIFWRFRIENENWFKRVGQRSALFESVRFGWLSAVARMVGWRVEVVAVYGDFKYLLSYAYCKPYFFSNSCPYSVFYFQL